MIEILIYATVFLVILPIVLLLFGSIKGMFNARVNVKKKLLLTIPVIICITPCLIILGYGIVTLFLKIFGSNTIIEPSENMTAFCCISGVWIAGILIGLGLLIMLFDLNDISLTKPWIYYYDYYFLYIG